MSQFTKPELLLLQKALVPGLTPADRPQADELYEKLHTLIHGSPRVFPSKQFPVSIPCRWPEGHVSQTKKENGYFQKPKKEKVPLSKSTTPPLDLAALCAAANANDLAKLFTTRPSL